MYVIDIHRKNKKKQLEVYDYYDRYLTYLALSKLKLGRSGISHGKR